jgi:hypothetical protein
VVERFVDNFGMMNNFFFLISFVFFSVGKIIFSFSLSFSMAAAGGSGAPPLLIDKSRKRKDVPSEDNVRESKDMQEKTSQENSDDDVDDAEGNGQDEGESQSASSLHRRCKIRRNDISRLSQEEQEKLIDNDDNNHSNRLVTRWYDGIYFADDNYFWLNEHELKCCTLFELLRDLQSAKALLSLPHDLLILICMMILP